MSERTGSVVVIGAGQAGALLSIYLARQGHQVTVYESRPDLRRTDIDAGKSINLALATRGIVPLVDVGVIDKVDEITIPMRGRMIHQLDDPAADLLPYGRKPHEVIHSVGRTDLNAILLDAAEATRKVSIEFDTALETIDFEASLLHFEGGRTEPFGVVFGADGAGSRVRKAIATAGSCEYETEWLDHDYKELTLPPSDLGSHRLDANALHIWPRGQFMLIALANPEGDFTVTLFAPRATFAELTTPEAVDAFFTEEFAGFAAHVPDLAEQFFDNPTGRLGTMKATGWSHEGQAVLVGDAAHAIVPFHGQGMNAALESVRALDRHLRASPTNFARAFTSYEAERKPNADAIADMALNNYIEMRAGVTDPDYLAKRELALDLEERHPEHLSPRYNMVMFSTMPYCEAQTRAETQADIIAAALADPEIDVDALVRSLPELPAVSPLADQHALTISSLTYANYLKIPELLSLQRCISIDDATGSAEHDETLFIVIHQVYELWFKQMLHELDYIVAMLNADKLGAASQHLKRTLKILKTMVGQIDILGTMTPAEFASFRDFLEKASGFQSAQFRELEFLLGIKDRVRLDWFSGDEARRLAQRFEAPTLWDAFVGVLARDGVEVPDEVLHRDVHEPIVENEELQKIIIDRYGDESFAALCETLTDLDEGIQEWRYRHVMMVQRTIGAKMGTGGSGGASYLVTTLFKSAFPDLWAIRSEF